MKVVVNRCHGGFSLSQKAIVRYLELIGKQCFTYIEVKDRFVKTDNENPAESVLGLNYTFTEDCGESFSRNDWDKYTTSYFYHRDIERNDPALIQTVQELGEEANGRFAELEIVDIPDDIKWCISEYDGYETVEEQHRSW